MFWGLGFKDYRFQGLGYESCRCGGQCATLGCPHLFIVSRALSLCALFLPFSLSLSLSTQVSISLFPPFQPPPPPLPSHSAPSSRPRLTHDHADAQEVQMLAERYANALEIKKREVAMSQLELQMKLTEMGLVQ